MADYFTMVFSRCPSNEEACIEYALIGEGMRRTIRLAPGQAIAKCTTASKDIVIVNVFALSACGWHLPQQWQTPQTANRKIVGAVVHVPGPTSQPGILTAVAYCYRDDGKVESSTANLVPGLGDCSDENPCQDVDAPGKSEKRPAKR